ncbi:hypothetical protein EGM88_04125 [Aureibaculum marinum]|uniref:VanZ-like domain-containing protein n=1 Tax=Aureibaculum marinum TaxID=2487930 RepID=A0A3N4NS64_9FLAO|nr:VanZ family protein [Aureibaculum marinum]RPD99044.1 hypothetical protein EGM88_04125 [Aureibaculum marinum]
MLKRINQLLERNALIFAILLTLFVAFLSLVSLKGISKINISVSNSDKIGHIIAYFTLATSWFYVYRYQKKKWKFIALLVFIFGMVLEGLQGTLTSYRTADWQDQIANTLGLFISYALCYRMFKKQEK